MSSTAKHLYDQFPRASRHLLRNPRLCRLIAGLHPSEYRDLDSASSVYWKAYTLISKTERYASKGDDTSPRTVDNAPTGLIDDGLKVSKASSLGWRFNQPQPARSPTNRSLQVRLAFDMIGAIAFKMVFPLNEDLASLKRNEKQVPLLPLDKVSNNAEYFLNRAMELLHDVGGYFWDKSKPIDLCYWKDDIDCLRAMDSLGLKYMTPFDSIDYNTEQQSIAFTNLTVRNFFAASWLLRWSRPQDRAWLLQAFPDPYLGNNKPEYAEFWDRIIELAQLARRLGEIKHAVPPSSRDEDGKDRIEELFAPLYAPSRGLLDSNGEVFRSTEMIYRTWEIMAGSEVRDGFESEFLAMLNANENSKSKLVAQHLLTDCKGLDQFLPLCESQSTFKMGGTEYDIEKPIHVVTLTHYRLHRYCVTNEEFELFEPRRKHRRTFENDSKFKGIDFSRHPVLEISWYDAMIFTRWLGTFDNRRYRITLPTEAQWEYACRAGQSSEFSIDGQDGDKIESIYCNFNGQHPWPNGNKSIYRERTVSVEGITNGSGVLGFNPWEFCQMHGNVWEWCQDWFDANYYSHSSQNVPCVDPAGPEKGVTKVLRGGHWFGEGGHCRSAYRYKAIPSTRRNSIGFRLAAKPVYENIDETGSLNHSGFDLPPI